jgi:hypothetical protein
MLTKAELQAITWDKILVPDGHGIYGEELYEKAGVPRCLWQHLVLEHVSDVTNPTETIYRQGKAVGSVRGVFHLDFLWALADELGADPSEVNRCRGRGRQAEALVEAIKEVLQRQDAKECGGDECSRPGDQQP